MFEHISDFTTWPILTGILVGYIANRIWVSEFQAYSSFCRLKYAIYVISHITLFLLLSISPVN